MTPSEYQKAAARTLIDKPGFEISDKEIMAIWCSVGLSGETGEVAELLKKGIFHQHGVDPEKLKKELGDVCWYLAGLCTVYGFDLGEIMRMNIDKLLTRYPNGYNPDDSKKRIDTK